MPPTKDVHQETSEGLGVKTNGKSREKLRPWLEALIDSGDIPGLCWLDRGQRKFKIPWKHGGKQDWSPESGRIFLEWAKNTGRYREGVDKPHYARWKTRLRCAFNKAPDIVEVVHERQPAEPDPYRVYLLKADKGGRSCRSRNLSLTRHRVSSSYDSSHLAQTSSAASSVASLLPAVLNKFDSDSCSPTTGGDTDNTFDVIDYITSADQQTVTSSTTSQLCDDQQLLMTDADCPLFYFTPLVDSHLKFLPNTDGIVTLSMSESSHQQDLPVCDGQMRVKVKYCGHVVVDVTTKRSSCHFQYGNVDIRSVNDQLPADIATQAELSELIELPSFTRPRCVDTEKVASQLLSSALCQAVMLSCTTTGDIFAYRLCRCGVFQASELMTKGLSEKIPLRGDSSTKIFDYGERFLPALNKYMMGEGPRPSADVHLLCGQSLSVDNIDDNVLIHVTVTSDFAQRNLDSADTVMAQIKTGTMLPCSDTVDKTADDHQHVQHPAPPPPPPQQQYVQALHLTEQLLLATPTLHPPTPKFVGPILPPTTSY